MEEEPWRGEVSSSEVVRSWDGVRKRGKELSEIRQGGTGQHGGTAEEVRLTSGQKRRSSSKQEVGDREEEVGMVVFEGKVEEEAEGGELGGGDRRRRRETESNVRQQQ